MWGLLNQPQDVKSMMKWWGKMVTYLGSFIIATLFVATPFCMPYAVAWGEEYGYYEPSQLYPFSSYGDYYYGKAWVWNRNLVSESDGDSVISNKAYTAGGTAIIIASAGMRDFRYTDIYCQHSGKFLFNIQWYFTRVTYTSWVGWPSGESTVTLNAHFNVFDDCHGNSPMLPSDAIMNIPRNQAGSIMVQQVYVNLEEGHHYYFSAYIQSYIACSNYASGDMFAQYSLQAVWYGGPYP